MKEKQEKSHGIHFVMIRRIGSWNCAEEEGAARSFYFFPDNFFRFSFAGARMAVFRVSV